MLALKLLIAFGASPYSVKEHRLVTREEHGVQNPALYDNLPKFLRDSLLGIGDTMPDTVRRMTGASADRFMLKDCGYVKEGFFLCQNHLFLLTGIPTRQPFSLSNRRARGQGGTHRDVIPRRRRQKYYPHTG